MHAVAAAVPRQRRRRFDEARVADADNEKECVIEYRVSSPLFIAGGFLWTILARHSKDGDALIDNLEGHARGFWGAEKGGNILSLTG